MADPSQFDTMINWAFAIATAVYGVIGIAGYLMFGNSVSDEVNLDNVYVHLCSADIPCSSARTLFYIAYIPP